MSYEPGISSLYVSTDPEVEEIERQMDQEIKCYGQATFSESTKSTYLSHLIAYIRFCSMMKYKKKYQYHQWLLVVMPHI